MFNLKNVTLANNSGKMDWSERQSIDFEYVRYGQKGNCFNKATNQKLPELLLSSEKRKMKNVVSKRKETRCIVIRGVIDSPI